jgi:hypothetical protein
LKERYLGAAKDSLIGIYLKARKRWRYNRAGRNIGHSLEAWRVADKAIILIIILNIDL